MSLLFLFAFGIVFLTTGWIPGKGWRLEDTYDSHILTVKGKKSPRKYTVWRITSSGIGSLK